MIRINSMRCWMLVGVLFAATPSMAQITSNAGDGVLNAPYRGTITSLRTASEHLSYGEVQSWIEPQVTILIGGNIELWIDVPEEWDRSVLRLYEGLDASEAEVRLDQSGPSNHIFLSRDADKLKRLSLKAIATKTLTPLKFTFHYAYSIDGGGFSSGSRSFFVAPLTGSFLSGLPGLQEAFHFGTEILRVSAGGAELVVPIGRTRTMIGAAFDFRDNDGWSGSGSSKKMHTTDALLPGAAESVFIANFSQFRLNHSSFTKNDWGTPWAGHLPGFSVSGDSFGPDGTHYDSFAGTSSTASTIFRRYDRVRPLGLADSHAASIVYEYAPGDLVTVIRDQQTPSNSITLSRTGGEVTRITTSDSRGWDIQGNAAGWITGIVPDSGKGARFFDYNMAGRVTKVKDASTTVLFQFDYVNDADGLPTILVAEQRLVDGLLRPVVEHEIVSPTHERRKEYVAGGQFRQYDFIYDGARLVSETSYLNLNGVAPAYTTTYVRDVENPAGTVKLTQVQLPDTSTLDYEYDGHQQQSLVSDPVHFGFRTKTTHSGVGGGTLVTRDLDYEFFYSSSGTRMFPLPRIEKARDGRGPISEVTFDFEQEAGIQGSLKNRLLSRTGPTITLGPSGAGARTPRVDFFYNSNEVLDRQETTYAAGMVRTVSFGYDELLRQTSQIVDPGGENLVTEFRFCDALSTQDRITVAPSPTDDPGGYWTRTKFDNDGRVTDVEHFLNVGAGNLSDACPTPTGPSYKVTSIYDTNGRLNQQVVENKDQVGVSLIPETFVTDFAYDPLGRLTLQTVDSVMGGIGQESNFDYNWQGEIERQFDTSGRGLSRTYDGRGLVDSETPLAANETLDPNLITTFDYDNNGSLRFVTSPTGAIQETEYDDFGRVEKSIRTPGPDGGNDITTTFTYDAANNVTRAVVDEATAGALSDSTAKFDEGGFNFETRQRTTFHADGVDDPSDPVTQYEFDWAGNVTVERSLAELPVENRVITTVYDNANRVFQVLDSEGGMTTFTRDDRGNVIDQTVKLTAVDDAVTTMVYDGLGRATQITEPEDADNNRADRIRRFNSRGNLLFESLRDSAESQKMTTVFAYDNAGRQTRRAVLADAASTIDASLADVTIDQVTDFEYDADGRIKFRITSNNNAAASLATETTYDVLGRVDRVTDASNSYTNDNYDLNNGRLASRHVFDDVDLDVRIISFGYDGHDRVTSQTREGPPSLTTWFELDGLDRQIRVTDPRNIVTRTDYDLVGRRKALIENEGGLALERQTNFTFNRLNQLVQQTASNKTSGDMSLPDEITTFRYDTLGRPRRILNPDNENHTDPDPEDCIDCVRMEYDFAGRMTTRTDQRGSSFGLTFTHDDRGLLLTRTVGNDVDTFGYDALGRITLAQRGTVSPLDPAAVSESVMDYTGLGDLDFETQTIAGGQPRTVNYDYDQAGNRIETIYPGGEILAFVPTSINQVDSISLINTAVSVDYVYQGRLLDKRITTTDVPGTSYTQDVDYDSHRRIDGMTNSVTTTQGSTTIADYLYQYDDSGNVTGQMVLDGMDDFKGDDRAFEVDNLNRLTETTYFETGEAETSTFDLVGNRETHTDRSGATSTYTLANPANEYATIDGVSVTYDAAGNLQTDEANRQYFYDEANRLVEVQDAGAATLASYTYDAFGRRISSDIDNVVTRYYYDGQSVIEERDVNDARMRFHVNGSQFIDERVTSFEVATGEFTYPLLNRNFSVAGSGNADGSIVTRLDFSAAGDFTQPLRGFFFDADGDADIDLPDLSDFVVDCLSGPGGGLPLADCERHDWDGDGDVDVDDFAVLQLAFGGQGVPPPYFVRTDATYYHDADGDNDVDLDDAVSFSACQFATDARCLGLHDFDSNGVSDGLVNDADLAGFNICAAGPLAPEFCLRSTFEGSVPTTGSFTLHGRPVDVLSDGKVLTYVRARYYDAKNARWLQRDPKGNVDGPNLYEAFRGNAMSFTDPFGKDAIAEFFLGPAGKNISTLDVIFSRETAADLTFGLIQTNDPSANIRRRAAFKQGVVSPSITAGEFALTGPTAGIGNFLLRNAAIGVIFGAGEFSRDLFVENRVQSLEEFAITTGVFTAGGAVLEGVFLVGGRLIAVIRQRGQSVLVDVSDQLVTSAAGDVGGLAQSQLGQLVRQAEAESSMILAAAGRQQLALQQGVSAGALRLQLNVASGELGELTALGLLRSRGETIISTQFRQGAVLRGFDSLSVLRSPQGINVFLNEVRNSALIQSPSKFSAFGLNRASTFQRNLQQAQLAVQGQVMDPLLMREIISALQNRSFTVRLIGRAGIRITPSTSLRIQQATGTARDVVILNGL